MIATAEVTVMVMPASTHPFAAAVSLPLSTTSWLCAALPCTEDASHALRWCACRSDDYICPSVLCRLCRAG